MDMKVIRIVLAVLCSACAGDNTSSGANSSTATVSEPERLAVLGGDEIAGQGDNSVVLEWTCDLTNFSAFADTLVVRENRQALYRREGENQREEEFVISEAQWSQLVTGLTANRVCELVSHAEGEHEEQRPRLTIVAGEMRCQVGLWDSEWTSDTRAAAIRSQVRALFPPEI